MGDRDGSNPIATALMVGGHQTTTHQLNKGYFGCAKIAT